MIPSNELAIAKAIETLAGSLNDGHAFSAYPQLSGVFYGLQANLQNLVGIMLMTQRDEALYGKTEAAKLYALQYKQTHALPEGILKSIGQQQWYGSCDRPLAGIVKYAREYRGLSQTTLELTTDEATLTTFARIDLESLEVHISWKDCALSLRLPNVTLGRGEVNGPLFHEPYTVEVDSAYLDRVLYSPMFEFLVGPERRPVEEPKALLIHHYFGTKDAPIELPGDHPLIQLRHLVNAGLYGKGEYSFATIDWKDYTLSFNTQRDWNFHESLLLTVDVQEKKEGTPFERHRGRSVYNWWKNPLLVNDLLADMDSLIDKALTAHELELAGQPGTV